MLKERICKTDYMTALKEKNSIQKLVIAELKGAIKNKEIDSKKDLSDSDIVAIIKKCIKELNESIDGYLKVGNEEMATELQKRTKYFDCYLPEALSHEEIEAIVETICKDYELTMKNMGNIMKSSKVALEVTGKDFDSKLLSELVRAKLS